MKEATRTFNEDMVILDEVMEYDCRAGTRFFDLEYYAFLFKSIIQRNRC